MCQAVCVRACVARPATALAGRTGAARQRSALCSGSAAALPRPRRAAVPRPTHAAAAGPQPSRLLALRTVPKDSRRAAVPLVSRRAASAGVLRRTPAQLSSYVAHGAARKSDGHMICVWDASSQSTCLRGHAKKNRGLRILAGYLVRPPTGASPGQSCPVARAAIKRGQSASLKAARARGFVRREDSSARVYAREHISRCARRRWYRGRKCDPDRPGCCLLPVRWVLAHVLNEHQRISDLCWRWNCLPPE